MYKFLNATFLVLLLTVGLHCADEDRIGPIEGVIGTRQDHQPAVGAAVPVETDPGAPVPITRVTSAGNSGIKEKLHLVIRDRDTWRDVWRMINATKMQVPALPEIDFSREMVVVAGLGQKPSGGYGIRVDRAYEKDDRLDIDLVTGSPGRSCLVPAVLTQPVDVVRLPRTERSVIFHETEIVHDCKR
jgi:hypothetical protein